MKFRSLAEVRSHWLAPLEALIKEQCQDGVLLGDMIDYHFQTGGKRIRGLLPTWVMANLAGNASDALTIGAGLEVLHNATLVHDDIQDGDTHRRGRPTVWKRWGEAQGINVGDSLFFHGLSLIAKAQAGGKLIGPVCDAMQKVVRGQVMEFQLQLPEDAPDTLPQTFENFSTMAGYKTGALFAICLEAGAIAAGVSVEFARAHRDYGMEVGLLFQIQDDFLDLVGEKGRAFKGADIAEGKLSYPVVWTYEHGNAAQVAELKAIVRRPRAKTTEADVAKALEILNTSGALEATADRLRRGRDTTVLGPVAEVVPGLVDLFLAPVVHAL